MNNEPIFIVGSPRSGTTLLSAMLNNHKRLCCGPETQFFNKINLKKLRKHLSSDDWIENSISLLCDISLSNQSVLELFGFSNNDIFNYLSNRTASVNSVLESLCHNFALKNNKERWIEKTPNHLLHLITIRDLYPKAKIIRIIRDPRDSSISIAKLPWSHNNLYLNCKLWKKWYEISESFFENDNNNLTLKYESLVNNPKKELESICNYIDEEFSLELLDTSNSSSQIISNNEPWKKQVGKPLDRSRLYIWKNVLNNKEKSFVNAYFYSILKRFNYEVEDSTFINRFFNKLTYIIQESIKNFTNKIMKWCKN